MKFIKFYLLLVLPLFYSCVHTNKNQLDIISLTGNISEEVSLLDLFDEFEYISLETSKESIFGEIRKLIVFDNKYYILDNHLKKIFVFQADGTFVQTIGRIGEGPGEYSHLEDFTIDEENNRIVILGFPSKAYIYDLNGNFISQKLFMSSPVWSICCYNSGFICSSNHQNLSGKEESLIYLLNKDFNLKAAIGKTLSNNTLPPFVANPIIKDGNQIYYFDNLNSRIYLIDTEKPNNLKSIDFDFNSPITQDILSDPFNFMSNQGNYSFFTDAYLFKNTLWASFANQGKLCVLVKDLKNNNQFVAKYNSWYPRIMSNCNGYFFAAMSVERILEDKTITNAKIGTKYPIDYDSNPVILKFKPKNIFK